MGPRCSVEFNRGHCNSGLRLYDTSRNPYAFYLQVRCSDVDIFGRQPGFFPGRNAWFTHDWNTVRYSYTLTLGGVLAKSVNEVVFMATRYITDGEGTVEEIGVLRVPAYLSPGVWEGYRHAGPLEPDIQPGDLSRWGVIGPMVTEGQARALFSDDHAAAIGYVLDHYDTSRSYIPRYLVSSDLTDPTYTSNHNPAHIPNASQPPFHAYA